MITKLHREDAKEKLIIAAFIGFQLGAAGKDKNLGDYLRHLKLAGEDPKPSYSREGDKLALKRRGIVEKKAGSNK